MNVVLGVRNWSDLIMVVSTIMNILTFIYPSTSPRGLSLLILDTVREVVILFVTLRLYNFNNWNILQGVQT